MSLDTIALQSLGIIGVEVLNGQTEPKGVAGLMVRPNARVFCVVRYATSSLLTMHGVEKVPLIPSDCETIVSREARNRSSARGIWDG